jgi:hypothetical protein
MLCLGIYLATILITEQFINPHGNNDLCAHLKRGVFFFFFFIIKRGGEKRHLGDSIYPVSMYLFMYSYRQGE